jgi:amidase
LLSIDEALDQDAVGQAALVARHEVKPAELVEGAVARAQRLNPTLNAIIHPAFEEANRDAQTPPGGRFGGVPMAIKDLICRQQGQPFHEGSRFLKDEIGWVGPDDQDLAVRFRRAGLIPLGRTNTSEFGLQVSCEPLAYGPTHNPWGLGRSAGGSSGGSAAAVAAGIVPVAHGSDAAGSLRIPAAFCGLVGLKPTRHRLPLGPDFGDAYLGILEELALTRTVRDTAAILDAAAADDPGAWSRSWPLGASLEQFLNVDPDGVRVGIWPAPAIVPVDPRISDTVRAVASVLEELGHHVTEDHPDALDDDVATFALPHYCAGAAWVCDHHWPRVTGYGSPIPDEFLEPPTLLLRDMGRMLSAGALLEARELAQSWNRRLSRWWLDHDLLLLPTTPILPPAHGNTEDVMLLMLTAPFSISGQPAMSIPAGEVDGLPVGAQLVAAHGREDLLVQVAGQLEQATPWHDRRPALR